MLLELRVTQKPFLICSGGTTSRCAWDGHLTLDLRNGFKDIYFDQSKNLVDVGTGLSTGKLIKELSRFQRSFPIGLSGKTGMGYILTGGISPLSRSQGLAIDQIKEIRGIWPTGERFLYKSPKKETPEKEKTIWKGLCGAAPFLGIITNLKLNTFPLEKLIIWEAKINAKELNILIQKAEKWPLKASLQWMWKEEIYALVIIKIDNITSVKVLNDLKSTFNSCTENIYTIPSLEKIPALDSLEKNIGIFDRLHYEVLGLLSPDWGKDSLEIIEIISSLMSKRPHPKCSIASQQLGGVSSKNIHPQTSFVHRKATWKPWITAVWPAGDLTSRKLSLKWAEDAWAALEPYCPWIHLAQMHQHLPWHQKEINSAFNEWLPKLKELKSEFDPNNSMPPL